MPKQDRHQQFLHEYTRVQSSLRRYVYAHAPQSQQAEDILQQAAMVLWKKFGQFDPARGSFQQWSFGVVRNEVLRSRRDIARQKTLFVGDAAKMFEERLIQKSKDLDHRQKYMGGCIDKLPPKARRAFLLRYKENLKSEIIAKQLNQKVSAFRVLLSRARASLAKCVTDALNSELSGGLTQ